MHFVLFWIHITTMILNCNCGCSWSSVAIVVCHKIFILWESVTYAVTIWLWKVKISWRCDHNCGCGPLFKIIINTILRLKNKEELLSSRVFKFFNLQKKKKRLITVNYTLHDEANQGGSVALVRRVALGFQMRDKRGSALANT